MDKRGIKGGNVVVMVVIRAQYSIADVGAEAAN